MGVYINGIEMPKNCGECFACKAELSQEKKVIYVCCFAREETDCPLIPVPAHGRLIDADEFFASLSMDDKTTIVEAMHINELLVAAPTVIPAEEGE